MKGRYLGVRGCEPARCVPVRSASGGADEPMNCQLGSIPAQQPQAQPWRTCTSHPVWGSTLSAYLATS